MKYLALTLLLMGVTLAACSDDPVSVNEATQKAENSESRMSTAESTRMVPLRGRWDLALDLENGSPLECDDPYDTGFGIAFPSDQLTGLGRVTHLGRTTSIITFDACEIQLDGSVIGPGTFVHTGANGDALIGEYVGSISAEGMLSFDRSLADPPIVITDGTGRFEGASGMATGAGVLDFQSGTGSFWIEGSLSSVGSLK